MRETVGSATLLFRFPRFCINCLAGECVCVRGGTREPWSTRVEEERWKGRGELILTLTIGLPVQTFRRVEKGEEKGESRTVRGKRGVGKESVVEKKTTDSIASAKPDWTALSSSPS